MTAGAHPLRALGLAAALAAMACGSTPGGRPQDEEANRCREAKRLLDEMRKAGRSVRDNQSTPGLPVRVLYIPLGEQDVKRGSVLDHEGGDARFRLGYTAFALMWRDGRLLLIDAGPDRRTFLEMTASTSLLMQSHGEHVRFHSEIGTLLKGRHRCVQGIVLTHLHADHTSGARSLCREPGRRIPVVTTDAELDAAANHGWTREGLAALDEASCVDVHRLPQDGKGRPAQLWNAYGDLPDGFGMELRAKATDEGPSGRDPPLATGLSPAKGFPGVWLYPIGGHTKGSALVFAAVDEGEVDPAIYVFTGDIVNAMAGIDENRPKPLLYRCFACEDDPEEARLLLRELKKGKARIVVSHDLEATERLKSKTFQPWSKGRPLQCDLPLVADALTDDDTPECSADNDCVAVFSGDPCGVAQQCANSAIPRRLKSAHERNLQHILDHCVNRRAPSSNTCESVSAVCEEGTCKVKPEGKSG